MSLPLGAWQAAARGVAVAANNVAQSVSQWCVSTIQSAAHDLVAQMEVQILFVAVLVCEPSPALASGLAAQL